MMMKIAAAMDLGGGEDGDYGLDDDFEDPDALRDEEWEKLKSGTGDSTGTK